MSRGIRNVTTDALINALARSAGASVVEEQYKDADEVDADRQQATTDGRTTYLSTYLRHSDTNELPRNSAVA